MPTANLVSEPRVVRAARSVDRRGEQRERLANIGSAGVEQRLRRSVTVFGLTLLLVVAMRQLGAPVWSFGVLVLPFWVTGFLVYQGLFKT